MAFAAINSSKGPNAFSVVDTTTPQQPAPAVNHAVIDHAFAGDVSLKKRVYDAISASPQHGGLFQDIAQYTSTLQSRLQTQSNSNNNNKSESSQPPAADQPLAKKRKLENGQTATSVDGKDVPLQFYAQDISFAVPQRKKLTLEITAAGGYLRARNQQSHNIEFGIALQDIEHAVCLPVPEKAQRQFNFCIIPKNGDGVTEVPEGQPVPDTMVWNVPDGPPKAAFTGNGQRIEGSEHGEALIRRMLDSGLGRTKVIRPDDREFVSATPEAHRKGEKAYHVKAHKGSKDGYLFFLSTGILFGFKKPLLFFSFANIDSTSYTSVLQRTFNLNIATRADASEETQEFEFSMIDQADFAGIDAYVKRHGLQDASLAEARRAKKYNVNGAKGEEVAAEEEGAEGGESELQKAERELEDQEDEEEEDYDPGSEGESEGSGSSSEEENGDGEGGGDDDDDDDDDEEEDVVKDELGSEAEDVSGDEL